jgi:hypothetical protein
VNKIDLSKAKPGDCFCCRNRMVMRFLGPNTLVNKELYPYALEKVSGRGGGCAFTYKIDGKYTQSGLVSLFDLVSAVQMSTLQHRYVKQNGY